jgi:A/G-specific adenine glycosylase
MPPSKNISKPRRARERRRRALSSRGAAFRRRLLRWYTRHQRTLPWRGIGDPYKVLVSEIMLQQTQVSRVTEFYDRFLQRYPTLEDLAAAPADHVRDSWEGLGYYARARNLHATARQVVRHHDGAFPSDPEALRALPGIGRYTAGAVASFAFGKNVAAVDTNAERVLGRVFGVRGPKKSAGRAKRLWAIAESLVVSGRSSDLNQALMDLGATICTARSPRCAGCPVGPVCRGRKAT